MESDYTLIIIGAFFGFLALAALLLVPVWRFLGREEETARKWTPDTAVPPAGKRTNGEDHPEGEPPGEG